MGLPHKILVVDDEPDLELLVTQRFRKRIRSGDLSFVFALNGEDALAKLAAEGDVVVVLTDINMPVMDGLTLLGRLKDEYPLIRAVIASAYGDMPNIRTSLNRGAFDFVTKPIDFQDLEITLDRALEDALARRQAAADRERIAALHDEIVHREAERKALSRYLPPQVANLVVEQGGTSQLQGVEQPVAVLFADIRGFTTMSERMEAAEIVAMLNEFFTRMSGIIFECNGTLDKFIGDCIMALFGAPVPGESPAGDALAAAIRMQREVELLNQDRAARGEAPIAIGIGVHAGPAVVGNIGSHDRVQYTAIGDSVNIAARLVSKAAPAQILVSEHVLGAVEGAAPFEPLGEVELKGRTGKLNIYAAGWREA
jgi:adenylate cyclase